MKFNNPMQRQVFSIPQLIKQQYADLEPKVRQVLATPEIFSIQRIVLTGCGDSYAAALAVKHIFELVTDIPAEVVPTIDLARYYHPKQMGFAPANPLVIAVSNSGAVARIGEAVQYVNKHGAFSLGITGSPDSFLGKHASRILGLNIPEFEASPGVRTYMVSVMALLLLAIRIGEVRGKYTMNQAQEYREDMLTQADILEQLLPEMDDRVAKIVDEWQGYSLFDFVGAGFDHAAAFYGHAKILEATGKAAMQINSEEWLHLNFFAGNPDQIGTVVVANTTNPTISRTKEMITYAARLGRPLMIISDAGEEFFEVPAHYIRVPKTKTQITMPLTQFTPMALLAGHLCECLGEEYGRGYKDNWAFCADGACVKDSKIIIR